jgi:hypothetical protein
MAFDEEVIVEALADPLLEEEPLVTSTVGVFIADIDLFEETTVEMSSSLEDETSLDGLGIVVDTIDVLEDGVFETFYEDDLPIVIVEEEEIVWLADDERVPDDITDLIVEDEPAIPDLVSFDAFESIEAVAPADEPSADTQDPLSPIVSNALDVDAVQEELSIDAAAVDETFTSTFGPLPDEDLNVEDLVVMAETDSDLNFPEDFTPAVLQPEYVTDEEQSLHEIPREELVGDDTLATLNAPWSYSEVDHPEQREFSFEPSAEEILVPAPTHPPPPPPPIPAPAPPIQGGSLPGGGGGHHQVWNLGSPSKRYVNFAKRPAPRYPYDFWEKLSQPPPAPPPKTSAPRREIRWTQRFERTLQKDPTDLRPLYSRLLDLLRKKR